jgi:glycosyltransferase involved in cell wall biosynthesis
MLRYIASTYFGCYSNMDLNTALGSTEPHKNATLSIVIPAYNENGNVPKLHAELATVLSSLGIPWEVIVIDDGSTDNTWKVINGLHEKDNRVKGLRFSRNFGHQYALLAGFHHSTGDAVISMDADLQHPPDVIPRLFAKWQKGHKIVKTIRLDPPDYSAFKRLTSRLFYKMFSYLSGVRLERGMADYRLLDRQVVNDILLFCEEGLFLRGIVQWVGYSTATITYPGLKRFSGTTKYTLRKMLRFAWHGISSFSVVPLRIAVLSGFIASAISFMGIGYAIYGKLIEGRAVPGWASTIAIISFLFGILFILLGLLGEYIGRILIEVRQRPRFLISERLGVSVSASTSDATINAKETLCT